MSKKLSLGADHFVFRNAEALRYNPTHAELILWAHLRGRQLGVKFRRQHPLGIYIADFYCHQHKLIVEIDGSIHQSPEVLANDIIRQKHLETDGFKVLRFTNQEVFTQLEKSIGNYTKRIKLPLQGVRGLGVN